MTTTAKPFAELLTNKELLAELKKRSALIITGTVEDVCRAAIPGSWGLKDRVTLIVLRHK